jgi:hypothetical protein
MGGLLLFRCGIGRSRGLAGASLAWQPEALQVAIVEGRPSFCGSAMVIVVIHLIISDCCKSLTRLVNVTRLQQAFESQVASEPSRKAISSQFTILPLGMTAQLVEIRMSEFMGDDRKGAKIPVACRYLIPERDLQVNGVITGAVGGKIDARVWASSREGSSLIDEQTWWNDASPLGQGEEVGPEQVLNSPSVMEIPSGVGLCLMQNKQAGA